MEVGAADLPHGVWLTFKLEDPRAKDKLGHCIGTGKTGTAFNSCIKYWTRVVAQR